MRPLLVMLMGIPGAGKTTLASPLAERLGAVVLSRDTLRPAVLPRSDYSDDEKSFEVEIVRLAVGFNLTRGRSVVVDGISFERARDVESFRRTADESEADCRGLLLDVTVEEASRRVEAQRERGGHLAADRDAALVQRVAREFEPVPDWVIRIDTTSTAAEILESVLEILEGD